MSTKAYYPLNEIGAGKVGFSKTRSIIEAAFYGNNVVKVNTLKEAYNLAKNSPGTIVTDMPDVSQANPALTVTHWTKLLWMPFTRQGSRNCIMQPFTQALTLNSW